MTEHVRIPRQRTLTEADRADLRSDLSDLLIAHNKCNLEIKPEVAKALNHLTVEELGMLKRGVKIGVGVATIVGTVVIVAIVGSIVAVFTKGFWATLLIKQAGK